MLTRRAWVLLAIVTTLLIAVAANGSAGAREETASGAAFGGTMTLKLEYLDGLGATARGKVKTRRICSHLRRLRLKFLDPPSGKPRFTPSPIDVFGHSYNELFLSPRKPGTYHYRTIAFKTPVARGLKRAKCKTLRSPVETLVVPPPSP